MKFFDDIIVQDNKKGYSVCGDFCVRERTAAGTVFVLCDGIGSGIYANIAAISTANRMIGLIRGGVSVRAAAETIVASMHRARTENIPFAAFSAVYILPDGKFTAYIYEAPNPVLIKNNTAISLMPRFYTTGFEAIGEVMGTLQLDDSLLLFSDGVSQAGLAQGSSFGIGSKGVASFINKNYKSEDQAEELPERLLEMCKSVSGGTLGDDTTIALLHCREAEELTLLTGPPSRSAMDSKYAHDFIKSPGLKIVCGSTTTDIIARELKREVVMLSPGNAFGQPPEYWIEGIDLVTEGAITLGQVYNILDEPKERLTGSSTAERLCLMLNEADMIHLMIGNAANTAHDELLFKQVGVQVRKATVKRIAEKLKEMGKLVIERYY
ncbi:MAG: SpoIIE family protein phosphatase [Clostridiales bacterium]|nr:SpoIIE family protein phosphatase [Clostridiales bacterium]